MSLLLTRSGSSFLFLQYWIYKCWSVCDWWLWDTTDLPSISRGLVLFDTRIRPSNAAVLWPVSQTHVCGYVCQSPENREWSWWSAAAGLRGCRSVFSVLDRWVWRSDEETAAGQQLSGGSVSVLRQAHIPSGLKKIKKPKKILKSAHFRVSVLHFDKSRFDVL